jgi:flagellar hook-length control protein FliK
MISILPSPANTTPSTTAPSTLSATPSPFDAILSLEALAATCAALDVAPMEGSPLEESDETPGADVEDEDSDGEGPLAFLAGLLSVAMATPTQSADAAQGGTPESRIDDVLGGAGRQAAVTAEQPAPMAQVSVTAAAAADSASAADIAVANKLLTAVDTATRSLDLQKAEAAATQESTSALARAAEFLSQGPRHASGPRDSVPTPVHSPRWAEDFGARVAMMVRGGESTASLQLTPVDLGPVEINITVRDSQASIQFGAAQAETRALLEASIPRLREMLAAQGFNLMDASVSQGFTRQAKPDAPVSARHDGEPEADIQVTKASTLVGLLDTYA